MGPASHPAGVQVGDTVGVADPVAVGVAVAVAVGVGVGPVDAINTDRSGMNVEAGKPPIKVSVPVVRSRVKSDMLAPATGSSCVTNKVPDAPLMSIPIPPLKARNVPGVFTVNINPLFGLGTPLSPPIVESESLL